MRRLLTRWPPRFLRTSEAARFLALSARTLEKHRCYGTGPKYRKLDGRVSYALKDLRAWTDLLTFVLNEFANGGIHLLWLFANYPVRRVRQQLQCQVRHEPCNTTQIAG